MLRSCIRHFIVDRGLNIAGLTRFAFIRDLGDVNGYLAKFDGHIDHSPFACDVESNRVVYKSCPKDCFI